MRIDFHSHAFPAECFRLLQQYYPDVVELKEDAEGRMYAIWANAPLPAWDHDQRLIWNTMCSLPKWSGYFRAEYQKNESNGSRTADSQLVHQLRGAAWVPQTTGAFVAPPAASRELLPAGFPFDAGQEWVEEVQFGEEAQQKSEKESKQESIAKIAGFPDLETLQRAKKFVELPKEEQERILAEHENCDVTELPNHESRNPVHRARLVGEQAEHAPERLTEQRERSISIGREEVKQETEQYLCQQYTNDDGEMICQICKRELPFKLDDGQYYFEKVEFLPELQRRHFQNYLALCPNHGAMFQYANDSRDLISKYFPSIGDNQFEVSLAQLPLTIYFTKTHIADLRVVIEKDRQQIEQVDPP